MELIKPNLAFNFLGARYVAAVFSVFMVVSAFYVWFDRGESRFGTDYLGGHEIVVKITDASSVNSEKIRESLKSTELPEPIVQAFESGSGEYSIRVGGSTPSSEIKDTIENQLGKDFTSGVEVVKTDFVGPTIGQELRRKGLIAITIGLVGILMYIAWRFELAFALGAVVALFHDVIITTGVYLFFGNTINLATLAAALTIVGYSVNDTIIVFDRVREEIFKRQKADLHTVINKAINSTLSRTVITSLLTLFSAFALLIFGGGAIHDLALFLFVGVICGTYSTIFIASPVALAWETFRNPIPQGADEKKQDKKETETQESAQP